MKWIACLAIVVAVACAEVYFQESFDDGKWADRWVVSKNKVSEGTQGDFGLSAGKYHLDAKDKGLKTQTDARFYQISAKLPHSFSNNGKDLVLQYSVKHEQNIDCGGGYVKLMPAPLDQENFNGDSKYNIMFGPDICGSSTKRTHLIFNYKGQNHLVKKEMRCESDEFTHLYTLVVHPDNTYEVYIDQSEVQKGSLKDDWEMLPPKKIKDPQAKKPEDWVDQRQIADPEDKKPEGWDDIPAEIVDPEAKKPEDWDDELDGDWEAPVIDNPAYKGQWKPKMIDNPAYKGEWIHPLVDNPDWYDDNTLYSYQDNSYLGIEVWQVKAGTIFDNFLVTDDFSLAKKEGEKVVKLRDHEKEQKKADDEKKAEEAKKEEEANKAHEEENKDEL